MGRLLSLVRGVETSIRSRLGAWMQEVSLAGDQIPGMQADIIQLQTEVTAPGGAYVTQASWYVNSVTGNDANDGSALAPIKTLAQLTRRLDGRTFDPSVVSPVVDLTGDFSTEELNFTVNVPAITSFVISGKMTTLYSGTVSAYTAEVTGTSLAVLADASADFSALIGKRVRFTSGAANGMVCYVMDTSGGVTNGVVSTNVSQTASNANPAPGDTFVVEDWATPVRGVLVNIKGGPARNPPTVLGRLNDVFLRADATSSRNNYFLTNGQRTTSYIWGCRIGSSGAGFFNFAVGATIVGCIATDKQLSLNLGDYFSIRCVFFETLNVSNLAYYSGSGANYHYGSGTRASRLTINNSSQWEDIGPRYFFGSTNSANGVITLEDGCQCYLSNGGALVWGANTAVTSAAWVIRSGNMVAYVTKPTVTASGPGVNDVILGGAAAVAYGAIPAINAGNLAAMVARA